MTNKKRWIAWLCVIMLLSSSIISCRAARPIYIGFSGELTGKRADLGIQGRDGVQLAVMRLNEAGGVAGRPIELIIRDDLGTPEGALAADQALIEAGVVAIIGHMTSAQSIAAMPLIEETETVMLSPTTSTPELAGLDDYFFRINPDNDQQARTLAHQARQRHGLTRVSAIYDSENSAYTHTFWRSFSRAFEELGGQNVGKVTFNSSEKPDFAPLVAELRNRDFEGLLIIASAVDTAMIAQVIRRQDWTVELFASGWAQSEALIQHGGAGGGRDRNHHELRHQQRIPGAARLSGPLPRLIWTLSDLRRSPGLRSDNAPGGRLGGNGGTS
jgi:branched-chain amino acid transport system substrate-binding protein